MAAPTRNPVRSSKVTKPQSNQSTLSSFFGLSNSQHSSQARQGVVLAKKNEAKLVRQVSGKLDKEVTEIDLTSDDTEILRDISNKTSFLSQVSSSGFDKAEAEDISREEVVVTSNLKSNRPIGSLAERKENSSLFSYSATSSMQLSTENSVSSQVSNYTLSNSKSGQAVKQRTLPWGGSGVVNKLASKNPRLSASKLKIAQLEKSRNLSATVLSDEQQQVLKFILQDKLNVFYTGSAGTGKSVLLKELIRKAYKKYGSQNVAVTASTGLAAVNIGGQTINSFAGIGLGKESVDHLVQKIKRSKAAEKWKKINMLIIDEVSMIDGNLFHKLNQIAKSLRMSAKPFGGIQIVVTGDFFQLPPVPDRNGPRPIFCFQSPSWQDVVQRTVLLTKVFRQKGDAQLIDMLNALRIGAVDDTLIKLFRSLSRPVTYDDGLEPTELFPMRYEVDRANKVRLDKLPSQVRVFKAFDSGTQQLLGLLDNVMAVKELHLKEDAQVMMLKNKNEFLVNGSIGRVMYFVTPSIWEQVTKVYRGDVDGHETIKQVRLLTKCIGISYFPPELEKEISAIHDSNFEKLVQLAVRESTTDLLPVVKFSSIDGTSEIELVECEDFPVDTKNGSVNRKQLPLLLSWALSIHKSQGQTLERVKVDLNKVFENGQVYVALSRAVSKEALQIVGFNPAKIRCSPDVKKFYDGLHRFA